jgi:hypothetical protein
MTCYLAKDEKEQNGSNYKNQLVSYKCILHMQVYAPPPPIVISCTYINDECPYLYT